MLSIDKGSISTSLVNGHLQTLQFDKNTRSYLKSAFIDTSNKHGQHENMGSIVLPHLNSGWHVDQAILSEDERLVVIRFGKDASPECMRQDEVLYRIADKVKNFAVICK